jgi:hypothetical protein
MMEDEDAEAVQQEQHCNRGAAYAGGVPVALFVSSIRMLLLIQPDDDTVQNSCEAVISEVEDSGSIPCGSGRQHNNLHEDFLRDLLSIVHALCSDALIGLPNTFEAVVSIAEHVHKRASYLHVSSGGRGDGSSQSGNERSQHIYHVASTATVLAMLRIGVKAALAYNRRLAQLGFAGACQPAAPGASAAGASAAELAEGGGRNPIAIDEKLAKVVCEMVSTTRYRYHRQLRLLQVHTAGALFELEPSAFKVSVPEICMEAMTDPAFDVRLTAIWAISHFFEFWGDSHAIFDSVSTAMPALAHTDQASFDAMSAMHDEANVKNRTVCPSLSRGVISHYCEELEHTALITLAQTAVAAPSLLRHVIFLLCTHHANRPRLRTIIAIALETLATELGYADGAGMLREHMSFLLTQWLRFHGAPRAIPPRRRRDRRDEGSDDEGSADEDEGGTRFTPALSPLKLVDSFPRVLCAGFGVLRKAARGAAGGRAGGASPGIEHGMSRKKFLLSVASVLMPIVVLLESKRRWEMLEVLARELGYGDNDNGLKDMLTEHIAGIEAAVVPLYFASDYVADEGAEDGPDSEEQQQMSAYDHGAEVRQFVDRMLGRNAFNAFNRLQMVLHLLQRLAIEPFGKYKFLEERESWKASLNYIGTCGNMTIGVLLHSLNFMEILLWVQWQYATAVAGDFGPRRRLFQVLEFVVNQLGDADLMQSAILHTVSGLQVQYLIEICTYSFPFYSMHMEPNNQVLRMLVNVLLENSDGTGEPIGSGGGGDSRLRHLAALMLETVCTKCVNANAVGASGSSSNGKKEKGKGQGRWQSSSTNAAGSKELSVHMPMLITALLHKCLHHVECKVISSTMRSGMHVRSAAEDDEDGSKEEDGANDGTPIPDGDEDSDGHNVAATAAAAAIRNENRCVQVSMRVLRLLLAKDSCAGKQRGKSRSYRDRIGLFVGEFVMRAAPLEAAVQQQNGATEAAEAGRKLAAAAAAAAAGAASGRGKAKGKGKSAGPASGVFTVPPLSPPGPLVMVMGTADLRMTEALLELMHDLRPTGQSNGYPNGQISRSRSGSAANGVVIMNDESDDEDMGDDTGEGSRLLPGAAAAGSSGRGRRGPDPAATAALVRSFVGAMSASKNAIAVGRMPRLAKRSALATLRQHLLQLKAGGSSSKNNGDKGGENRDSVLSRKHTAELIGTLGELCGEVGNGTDEEVRLHAAQCLGELGAVDPCEVDLTCGSGDGIGNGVVFGDGGGGGGAGVDSSDKAAASQRQNPMVACTAGMLHLLAGYIADDDAEVAWVAALVVKATLTTQAGEHTFLHSSQEVIQFLQPFYDNRTQKSFKGEILFDTPPGVLDSHSLQGLHAAASISGGSAAGGSAAGGVGAAGAAGAAGGGGGALEGAGNEDDAAADDADDIWADEHAGLWRVRAGEYDAWICALSARMAASAGQRHREEHYDENGEEYQEQNGPAARSHGGVLGASAPLCALKADFAAHVFPFLAYELIMQSGWQQRGGRGGSVGGTQADVNATTLARRLTDILRETDCVEATRLVVRTVNFLREQQLTYFLEHHSKPDASASSKSRKRRRSGPSESDWAAENVGKGGVGIEIDPFVVARAAMGGGMPYTALLFVEYHREQQAKALADHGSKRGRGRGGSSAEADALDLQDSNSILLHMGYDDVSEYVDLLLQIYQHVNDPDSLYGVQRGSSLRSQIAAYR